MPSPFPGMDPFIEGQRWQDFHTTLIGLLKESLVPVVRPKYSVDIEQDVYREDILTTHTNLVELDFLRRGKRLPTRERLPTADYYAFICRAPRYPKVDVYFWTLRRRLPTIPIPLAACDADVSLDLQEAFTKTYDRSGYDYVLDYCRPNHR